MTHLLALVPQPEYINEAHPGYGYLEEQHPYQKNQDGNPIINRPCLTPYTNIYWIEYAAKKGISIPKILTRADGLSLCGKCGTKYAGKQYRCINVTAFYEYGDYKHKERGNLQVGEEVPGSYGRKVSRSFFAPCDAPEHDIRWDLTQQFKDQQHFFFLLDVLCQTEQNSEIYSLDKFKDLFSASNYEQLQAQIVSHKLYMLEQRTYNLREFLEQIARKIDSAGHCLRF
jgi:hypothetical protein